MNRNIDNLGRIVIPKEIRKSFGIKENDSLKIETIDNKIILYKNCDNLQEKIDKAKKLLNANTHVEIIYEALCNLLLDDKYKYEINNNELLEILKGE